MSSVTKATLTWLTLCLISVSRADDIFPDLNQAAELTVAVGTHEVILPSGYSGLTHFPDEPICLFQQNPLTFSLVSADSTYLMQGKSFAAAKPLGKILSPGPAGSIDNHYAGISSAYHDKKNKRWIGLYHAEDKEGIGFIELTGAQGFYGSVCAVEVSEDGRSVRKLGATITADKPKLARGWETEGGPPAAWLAQGVGEPCHCVSADEKELLCWYTEWSNRLKRGVQICMARCPIESAGMPQSWKKYHDSQFTEAGLGGHDTPVISAGMGADTYTPHVQYVKPWERYVMVFGCGVGAELHSKPPKPVNSGLYVTTSKDGIAWCTPVKIERVFPLVVVTQRCKVHPTLLITKVTDKKITGRLMYGFTPNWPKIPHHLGACTITLTRSGDDDSANKLKESLLGTNWINSNQARFEWDKNGRLLHNGVERAWKVVGDRSIEVTFGPEHRDILEFDLAMKTFKQAIKGGSNSFTGKRREK